MTKRTPLSLGDLVAAAYEAAGRVSEDDRSRSQLAAVAVRRVLLRAGRPDLARALELDATA